MVIGEGDSGTGIRIAEVERAAPVPQRERVLDRHLCTRGERGSSNKDEENDCDEDRITHLISPPRPMMQASVLAVPQSRDSPDRKPLPPVSRWNRPSPSQ